MHFSFIRSKKKMFKFIQCVAEIIGKILIFLSIRFHRLYEWTWRLRLRLSLRLINKSCECVTMALYCVAMNLRVNGVSRKCDSLSNVVEASTPPCALEHIGGYWRLICLSCSCKYNVRTDSIQQYQCKPNSYIRFLQFICALYMNRLQVSFWYADLQKYLFCFCLNTTLKHSSHTAAICLWFASYSFFLRWYFKSFFFVGISILYCILTIAFNTFLWSFYEPLCFCCEAYLLNADTSSYIQCTGWNFIIAAVVITVETFWHVQQHHQQFYYFYSRSKCDLFDQVSALLLPIVK